MQLTVLRCGEDREASAFVRVALSSAFMASCKQSATLVAVACVGFGTRLFQALSRCLIGSELAWNALQHAFAKHFRDPLIRELYVGTFAQFEHEATWLAYIDSCVNQEYTCLPGE